MKPFINGFQISNRSLQQHSIILRSPFDKQIGVSDQWAIFTKLLSIITVKKMVIDFYNIYTCIQIDRTTIQRRNPVKLLKPHDGDSACILPNILFKILHKFPNNYWLVTRPAHRHRTDIITLSFRQANNSSEIPTRQCKHRCDSGAKHLKRVFPLTHSRSLNTIYVQCNWLQA